MTDSSMYIATVKPKGEKLSTVEYAYDATKIGQKRLHAILKSKASSRHPDTEIVLFNLQILRDNRLSQLAESLRNQGQNCHAGSKSYRSNIVTDKGDQYQTEQPTMSSSCHKVNKNRQPKVASVDIYLDPAP